MEMREFVGSFNGSSNGTGKIKKLKLEQNSASFEITLDEERGIFVEGE